MLCRYNKFSLDITDALKVRTAQACPQAAPEPTAPDLAGHHKHKKSHSGHCQEGVEHVVVVRAWDPADTQRITVGKQRLFPPRHPAGIFYTSTSGIWQTVWLEPVSLAGSCLGASARPVAGNTCPAVIVCPQALSAVGLLQRSGLWQAAQMAGLEILSSCAWLVCCMLL